MEYKKAKQQLSVLLEMFDRNINENKSKNYKEANVRIDYIDPFFTLLGWDIKNEKGLGIYYRDVIYEDNLEVSGSMKAPDYSFNINGIRKFYVEAKRPSIGLKDSIKSAYQLRRYGWSAKLPISIITDFEEFSIYDCNVKPNQDDKASIARIKYLTYKDYLSEFDFLWETFSKEMVKNGSLEKYFQSTKGKRASSSVDEEFLKSLDSWRDLLAKNIVKNNPSIKEDDLNFSLQKVMDRIIFLRISEDRGVEDSKQLFNASFNNVYSNLKKLFHLADRKYNSGLFDFTKDRITDTLKIDDKVLKEIIEEMYYPKSPYEFSVIPVEIMGHSYEQYLGKTISIEKNHKIKIEAKPEVRKAGGVYYTPQYIVDYIVNNTVGKLIENKKPEEVAKLKICDPACGSGSFLLGAYQFLLDWHREYYNNAKLKNKNKFITPDGNLTTSLKKEILLNNIYGVDIDTNAVEVTKLSLMLKAMEGETKASISQQLNLIHDRVLPTLDNNIKSGNSLIDLDFYDNQINFEPGKEKKIKPFNWEQAFPLVFKQGGFDAVIGNPPYVQPIILDYQSQKFLEKKYEANTDLYSMFIEKQFDLIKKDQILGFIVPSLFIKGVRYESLRNVINRNCSETFIKEYGDGVFTGVQMPTCIIFLKKGENSHQIDHFRNNNLKYFNKIDTVKLQDITIIRRGLEIGRDKILKIGKIKCLNGGCIDQYHIKEFLYISETTLKDFNKNLDIFSSPKVIVRETGNKFFATIDNDKTLTNRSLYNVRLVDLKYSPFFILGIINSKLFKFYFKQFIAPETNIFPKIRIAQLNEIPISQNPNTETQNLIIKHVETMLQLNKDLQTATLPEQKEQIQQRIQYTDKKIDQLVYELYGLTEEEIKVVEGE